VIKGRRSAILPYSNVSWILLNSIQDAGYVSFDTTHEARIKIHLGAVMTRYGDMIVRLASAQRTILRAGKPPLLSALFIQMRLRRSRAFHGNKGLFPFS
jgi:hypothetical protein